MLVPVCGGCMLVSVYHNSHYHQFQQQHHCSDSRYVTSPERSSAVRPYACLVSLKNASFASVGISSSTIFGDNVGGEVKDILKSG